MEDRPSLTSSLAHRHRNGDVVKRKVNRNPQDEGEKPKASSDRRERKRCFNCGSKEHIGMNCPSKDKGMKCFDCNEFGHIAAKCPTAKKTMTTNSCACSSA